MTNKLRLPAGGTALAAGLLFLSGALAAPLSNETLKKAAETDIATLKEYLDVLAKTPEDPNAKGFYRSARAMSMMLAYYGEQLGDAALREQSLKVAEELEKISKAARTPTAKRATDGSNKVIADGAKAASALAGKLAVKPGAAPLKATPLYTMHKIDLEEIMGPFRRGEKYGGMNIEKDIRDSMKAGSPPIDPAAAQLIGARTAVIGEYTLHMPTDKAAMGANKAEWEKWTKQMIELSHNLSAEAGKGKSADQGAMRKLLDGIDGMCRECHNKYRDE